MPPDKIDSRKPSRFTFAPFYLAAGLVVCYFVLTRLIPVMGGIAEDGSKVRQHGGGWPSFTIELSEWVRTRTQLSLLVGVPLIMAGFILPIVWRPARYLIWLLALGVFLLDVALAAGGWWHMFSTLLHEANNLGP